ncbi:MAG: RagB/SusD family nutrient uptake outer membrane protein, partial [Muribaculaceae bacterium]|nr:RagB/SusD family nutrient uptake outer membrane protein [Muribaculaceae bacterium]
GYDYFNRVRERAGLDPISQPSASEILHERQCELYMEGHRRSDLIRFNRYTGSTYLWSWKGGVETGASIPDYRALFAIPYQYVATVGQNPGY